MMKIYTKKRRKKTATKLINLETDVKGDIKTVFMLLCVHVLFVRIQSTSKPNHSPLISDGRSFS